MAKHEKTIELFQMLVTMLSQQSVGHRIESRIFASQGLSKLGEKYAEHAEEEMQFVGKFIDRIIDLGGVVKNGVVKEAPVYEDIEEWLTYDVELSKSGLGQVGEILETMIGDPISYDLFKDYVKDEEEDMLWGEQQLELMKLIGKQNWLMKQI
ncbi:hypothetical protein A3842_22730 [Paenibacillus sp. P3E]|uniref:ferritin-like domain-containing protein n=1 Tax=Paenibacillus sp. P3E TaxID=1349435 RepID=UPI00093EA4C9|nr:ferritin-like domain-containing protein [Paenibacillus sp. P3E]OKP72620.1 hypothetical protein A3842_22730 [Paenibacillus sp. P3E]